MDFKIPELPHPPSLDDPNHYNEDPALRVRGNQFTNMAAWYPLVEDLHFVPATELTHVPYRTFLRAFDLIEKGQDEVARTLLKEYLAPGIAHLDDGAGRIFVRSFFHSAKHEVSQTDITDEDTLWMNVYEIMEATLLKDLPFEGLAYRQFIDLEAPFKAFNGLPIAKERRCFIERDGDQVKLEIIPYWPKKAIQFFPDVGEPTGWRNQLDEINKLYGKDAKVLEDYAFQVYERIKHLHPNWSLDFAKDTSGKWWFIDAAVAEASWRPEHGDFELS